MQAKNRLLLREVEEQEERGCAWRLAAALTAVVQVIDGTPSGPPFGDVVIRERLYDAVTTALIGEEEDVG